MNQIRFKQIEAYSYQDPTTSAIIEKFFGLDNDGVTWELNTNTGLFEKLEQTYS